MADKDIRTARSQIDAATKSASQIFMPEAPENASGGFYKPVVSLVHLHPDPERGDIYNEFKAKKWLPTATGWEKLIQAAGFDWNPSACGRADDRRNPDFFEYTAQGGVLLSDGRRLVASGHYAIDLKAEWEEAYRRVLEKEKDESKAHYQANKEVADMRRKASKLCETRARLRVARRIMAVFSKGNKNPKEYEKPLVVLRFTLDSSVPEIRSMMAQNAVSTLYGIWGGPPAATPAAPAIAPLAQTVQAPEAEEFPDPPDEDYGEPPVASTQAPAEQPASAEKPAPKPHAAPEVPPSAQPKTDAEKALLAMDGEAREIEISMLMSAKNFPPERLKAPIAEHSDALLLDLYRYLNSL